MKVELSINSRLLKKVKALSDRMDIDKDQLMIQAIKKFIFINEMHDIRKSLKPTLKKLGFNSEDDFFKAIS